MLRSTSLMYPFLLLCMSTAVSLASSPSFATHRFLQEFNFFEYYCQTEGASFLGCLNSLEDVSRAESCSNCHMSNIGGSFVLPCASNCGVGLDGCDYAGINAVDCINSKILEYHCRSEFARLHRCDSEDCSAETQDFADCLSEGFKLFRGRNITSCDAEVDAFDTCLDGTLEGLRTPCEKCYSDLGFGIINSTNDCSCGVCSTEGMEVASCIESTLGDCQWAAAESIQCLESELICVLSSAALYCGLDYSDIDLGIPSWNVTPPNYTIPGVGFNASDFDIPDVDWDAIRSAASSVGVGVIPLLLSTFLFYIISSQF